MIGTVKGNMAYANAPTANRQNTTNGTSLFKQQYTEAVNRDRTTFSRNQRINSQSMTAIQGDMDIKDLASFLNGLNPQADGSAKLTEEDIKELQEKYDLNNLTATQRLALLRELHEKNVLSYEDCRRSQESHIDIGSLMGAERSIRKMIEDSQTDAVLRRALTLSLKTMDSHQTGNQVVNGADIAVRSLSDDEPMDIYEEFKSYERQWRTKYQMLLEKYDEEHPEFLAYADSYAHIADVLKSLM